MAVNPKFFFAIESTDHVLACYGRRFLIFATWWRYRANENLHWNFLERHPVAGTIHVIHHSNRLDELIPNMYNTWVIWPLLVKKMVRVDRFWSFHLVCSEHTTYTHHSNRIDKLIPNIYDIWVNFIDLTTFGQKNGQSWPFLVISFSLFETYYIYILFEPARWGDSKSVLNFIIFYRFDHFWSKIGVKIVELGSNRAD